MSIRQSRSRLEKSALRILGEIILRIKIQMESDTALKNPYEQYIREMKNAIEKHLLCVCYYEKSYMMSFK